MTDRQYVIFKLGNEEYGIAITDVREITEYKETTKLPNTPDFIDGVINLRGKIVPVINLKKRFNIKETSISENNRIIIVNIGDKQTGFIVDEASQVLTLDENDIEEPPELISGIHRKYIVGVGKVNNEIVILLDFVEILSEDEKLRINEIKE